MSQSGTVRASGVIQANGETLTLDVAGQGSVAIQLADTWIATLVFEVSLTKDTWVALNVTAPNATSTVTGATGNGLWAGSVAGMQAMRVRCTAFTSGQVGVLLQAVSVGGGSASSGSGSGAVTIADGADVTQGAIADVKVTGDNSGTVEAKLRGLNYLWALVIDTANSWLKVSIQNSSLPVTQSGTWTVQPGNTANTTAWLMKALGSPKAAYDYTSLAQASTTDTWTFKSGGSGGSTVQTITVTYTDSTKTVISTVAWT